MPANITRPSLKPYGVYPVHDILTKASLKFPDKTAIIDGNSSYTFSELEEYTALVEVLSHRSYDLAIECLQLGQRVLPSVQDRKELISLARALAITSWREVRGCFEAMAKINGAIDSKHRARFMRLAERLSRQGMHNVAGFMLEMTDALGRVPAIEQGQFLELAESLVERSPESVVAFLKSVPTALERISLSQIDDWFRHGVTLLLENVDSGIAYFKLESSRSEQILDNLSSSVELDKVKSLFSFYARALIGSSVDLGSTDDITQKNIGWVAGEQATTDGKNVYLPLAEYYINNRSELQKNILSRYSKYVEKILFESMKKMLSASEKDLIGYLMLKCKKLALDSR